MIGLPKTTPTAAVMFSTGALFASIGIEMKQLIYLHVVLQKEEGHWTKNALYSIKEHNAGWARQIDEILETWGLELDWDIIKLENRNIWKKEVGQAAERLNKDAIKANCVARKRGEETVKTTRPDTQPGISRVRLGRGSK